MINILVLSENYLKKKKKREKKKKEKRKKAVPSDLLVNGNDLKFYGIGINSVTQTRIMDKVLEISVLVLGQR